MGFSQAIEEINYVFKNKTQWVGKFSTSASSPDCSIICDSLKI